MARERWFYAHDEVRHGPHQLPELVDALLALPDPRSRLVWNRGLGGWTRAGRVSQVSDELDRHLPGPETAQPAATVPPSATSTAVTAPIPRVGTRRPPRTAPPPASVAAGAGLPRPALYAGAALLLAVAVAAVAVGLRKDEAGAVATAAVGGAGGAAGTDPGAATDAPATGGDTAVVGWAAAETDVPATAFGLLKGVAAWENDELTVTVYNGSRWRITEILVRTSVLEGDQYVDSALLHPLTPREDVDEGVAPILERVAPDRRRPAANPDDTRAFTGKAGQKPRAYRWRIEAARGYAPIVR